MSDIRKWFVKKHDKDDGNAANPASSTKVPLESAQPAKSDEEQKDHESAVRRKTSKYFSSDSKKEKDEMKAEEVIAKRKFQPSSLEMQSDVKPPPRKKVHKIEDEGDDDDNDDFVETATRRADVTPNKKLKNGSGKGIVNKSMDVDGSDEDYSVAPKSHSKTTSGRGRTAAKATCMDVDGSDGDDPDIKDMKSSKSAGRGRGGRATTAALSSGRGRGGGGRGGYMNFADRKDPPHKGEKEIPEGSPDCLANLTFVISGTLDSLEREEAEELIKRHGGRVTGSVSKKTNYLLCDEDIGGRKSAKAQELGTTMLTEDGLFDMIRLSNKSNSTKMEESPNSVGKVHPSPSKMSTTTPETKKNQAADLSVKGAPAKENKAGATTPLKPKTQSTVGSSLQWTEKHRPKVPNDIIGNQSLVKQLHDWLLNWNGQFLGTGSKTKGKKPNDAGAKKAVLLSGTPGIGKTTAARLVSQMLGFNTIEVNASDSRGKADAKIGRGIGGSTANTMKELISNEALSRSMERSQHPKTVLIMDEVDGMSAGDRGGVADLISSIKSSKIPIICICNDRYSQKLKSLVNYCLLLSFRKPTKQQMAKRLMQIASAEGLQANEIALEELAERVNGDMRLALNQLQYMSVSMSVIKYDDIRQRLQFSSKDEDISPFTAVDKLFGFNSVKLRMDERIDLSMSDPDLVPLLIQENYINYRPSSAAKDDNGVKRMELIARAAESISDGDIINVQIRRYRQWQLFQSSSVASSIIPASLLHGQRETLEQGERNFNRFGGWLGKNSTMGKNYRLLEDLHVHILASRESYLGRTTLRLDYLTILLKQLTDTLRFLPKDEAVEKVVEFMDTYSISQEDFDTIVEISKFQGRPSAMEGIPPAVKAALTKAYKKGSSSRVIRTADMITLPGIKKAVKKRVTAMLEPEGGGLAEDIEDEVEVNGEENSSDSEDDSDREKKLMSGLQSLNLKGVQVQMELKGVGSSGVKKASGRGRGSSQGGGGGGGGGRGSGSAAAASKRKR